MAEIPAGIAKIHYDSHAAAGHYALAGVTPCGVGSQRLGVVKRRKPMTGMSESQAE